MEAKFVSIEHIKSKAIISQGYESGDIPGWYYQGGGNTRVSKFTPPKLILKLQLEDGEILAFNVISIAKKVNDWKVINRSRVEKLRNRLARQKFIVCKKR